MCLLALSHCCSCLSEVLLEIHFKIKLLRHRTTQWFIQQGFSCVIKCTSYPDIPWSSFLSWSDLDKTMLKFRRTGCWHQLFWMISSDSRATEKSQLVFKVLHSAPGKFGICTGVLCQKEKNPTGYERAASAPLTHSNICEGILCMTVSQKSQR